jgi:hypothetical protein
LRPPTAVGRAGGPRSSKACSGRSQNHTVHPVHRGRAAMNFTPEQVQEHIDKLSTSTVEDLDDLLHDLCCIAWPTTDGQNN